MAKVNVIYHQFPHYRAPVMRELALNGKHEYCFFGSHDAIDGIKPFKGDDIVVVHPLYLRHKGRRWILKGYWPTVLDPSVQALIVIGNPNMPASWLIALVGRFLGKKTMFWAHGWLKPEPPLKQIVRNIYFRMAHRTLVYGERAKALAESAGFVADRVTVIYNSLDFDRAQQALGLIEGGTRTDHPHPKSLFDEPSRPLLVCTARLTALCRFDLLLSAANKLSAAGKPVNILLVGDGPERARLEDYARVHKISVHFFGECYDEDVLANLIYYSDLTVSPGKIGLTAIHSLTYGTPAITHGDLDEQMPEVEAIEPGKSGLLFERNNADDLAEKIMDWLARDIPRSKIRAECQRVIAQKWNPVRQRELIDEAIAALCSDGQ